VGVCVFIYIVIHNGTCNLIKTQRKEDMTNDKKWYVVNRFNGAVQVVVSESRMKAMEKGRSMFGSVALDLYAVN